METNDIKKYINIAKKLEVAIYTEEKLENRHKEVLLANSPRIPQFTGPKKPEYSQHPYPQPPVFSSGGYILVGIALLMFWLCYAHMKNDAPFYALLTFCIGAFFAGSEIKRLLNIKRYKEEYQYKVLQFKYYREKEREALQTYETELANARQQHQILMEKYKKEKFDYDQKVEKEMAIHTEIKKRLEDALIAHYDADKLFPKYRELVAVLTFDEYLQSGRCDSLEGSNGAYNLYEMELRQNIIIGQLNKILDNMELIKNNQYTLYQELSKANTQVEEIIFEIQELKSLAKLNSYFSMVTAIAELSPKRIHGYIG